MKWLLHAWQNVWRNTRRSAMAAGVIGLGAGALAMTVGFMLATFFGLGESTIRTDIGHIQISARGGFENETDIARGLDDAAQKEIADKLAAIDGVRFSMPRILFDGLASKGNATIAIVGRGVEPMKEQRLSSVFAPLTAGQTLGMKGEHFEALLGDKLSAKLGWVANDLLTLIGTTEGGSINAVDVTTTGAYNTGVPDRDSRAVMVPLAVAKALLETDRVTRMVVVLKETAMTDRVVTQLKAALPDLDIRDWKMLDPYYQQVVTLYRNIFGVLSLIIIVVVLMSVSNTMMMTVFERIKEIGTLRAIGFSRAELRANFAIEGSFIGVIGGFAGLLFAAALSFAINLSNIQMPPAPGRTASYPLFIFVDGTVYSIVAAIMIACGLIGAWLPAARGSRIGIVEALGHD